MTLRIHTLKWRSKAAHVNLFQRKSVTRSFLSFWLILLVFCSFGDRVVGQEGGEEEEQEERGGLAKRSNTNTNSTTTPFYCSGTVVLDARNTTSAPEGLSGIIESNDDSDAYQEDGTIHHNFYCNFTLFCLKVTCIWYLYSSPNQTIQLQFTRFGLELNWDSVEIFDDG